MAGALLVLQANTQSSKAGVPNLPGLAAVYAQFEEVHFHVDVANAGIGHISSLGSITDKGFDLIKNTDVEGVHCRVQGRSLLIRRGCSTFIFGSTASMNPGPVSGVYRAKKQR